MIRNNNNVKQSLWVALAENGGNSVDDIFIVFIRWNDDDKAILVFSFGSKTCFAKH